MTDKWREDLVSLLKFLEKSHFDSSRIHDFRRGLESCNLKKAEKVLPQLFEIYNQSKEHLECLDFDFWILKQSFPLKLGLRNINLCPGKNVEEYPQYVKWALSCFDPKLNEGNPNNMLNTARGSGLPVSGKQLKMAMRKVQGMNPEQLSSMMNRVPQNQLEALASNPAAEELVAKLKSDKRAQVVAEKVRGIKEKDNE